MRARSFHILSVSLLYTGLPVLWQTDFLHMLADMDSRCLLYICLSLSFGLGLLCQSQLEQSQRQPCLVYLGYILFLRQKYMGSCGWQGPVAE